MSKKRLRHCHRTVQKSKHNVFHDRIVTSSKTSLESSNWRHDFARFANISYADMAKRKIASTNSGNDGTNVTCCKKFIHPSCTAFENNKALHIVGKTGKITHKCKIGLVKRIVTDTQSIMLKNRFQALSTVDSEQLCYNGKNLDENSENDTPKNVCLNNRNRFEKQPEMAQSLVKSQIHNNVTTNKAPRSEVACSAGNSGVPGNPVPKNGSFAKVFNVKESMSLYDKYA